ncbi:beta-lactamase family protein [Actinoplanes sp. NBC_00393]|uniref:serine hydrolase domain-containing protein n=1 Tax=Actinoplanes sp. NBC_00393 TaxID=2975953 RepID=UPI002E1CB788
MPITRRGVLGAGAAAALTLTGCGDRARFVSPAAPSPSPSGSPPAAPEPFDPAPLRKVLTKYLKPTKANPRHPTYAGAVALVTVNGKVTAKVAVGHALRYGAGAVELPAARRVAMRADSIFDLASLTKIYTAILLLQQVAKGRIDLDAPVARYLPAFTGKGKSKVTVRMLLTHTSGLPVGAPGTLLTTPLVKGAVPGDAYRYSSAGLMVAAELVEKATGTGLAAALKAGITGPLGLRDTGFTPLKWLSRADRATRLVATDARTSRGLLRGIVHDDVAARAGGVIGSAGIFATAADVAAVTNALLDGDLLPADLTRQMLTNQNRGRPAYDPDRPGRPSDHGLGVTLRQRWFMGGLTTPATFGHTGFTGTSVLAHPGRRLVLVLLTNRAHPNWSWANPDPMRAEVADVLAGHL